MEGLGTSYAEGKSGCAEKNFEIVRVGEVFWVDNDFIEWGSAGEGDGSC